MNKILYKGVFNLRGDVITKYTHANSEDQAFRFICKDISKDMNLRNDIDIRHYFWGTDHFKIYEIKEVNSCENKDCNKAGD